MIICEYNRLKGQCFRNCWLVAIKHVYVYNRISGKKKQHILDLTNILDCWLQWDKAGPLICHWVCIWEFSVYLWMLCFHSSLVASDSKAEGLKPKHCVGEIKREKKIIQIRGSCWLAVTQMSWYLLISRLLRTCHLCASLRKRSTWRKWQEMLPPGGPSGFLPPRHVTLRFIIFFSRIEGCRPHKRVQLFDFGRSPFMTKWRSSWFWQENFTFPAKKDKSSAPTMWRFSVEQSFWGNKIQKTTWNNYICKYNYCYLIYALIQQHLSPWNT